MMVLIADRLARCRWRRRSAGAASWPGRRRPACPRGRGPARSAAAAPRPPTPAPRAARAASPSRAVGFGTSTPTAPRPGIGATRMRARAHRDAPGRRPGPRSGPPSRPAPGTTSNWVTTGPVVRPATSPSTLKVRSVSSSDCPQPVELRLAGVGVLWCGGASSSSIGGSRVLRRPAARRGSASAPARPWPACRHASPRPCAPPARPAVLAAGVDHPRPRRSVADLRLPAAGSPVRRGRLAAPSGSSGCRSSRCSGCQASVASVSAESARKPSSTAPATPMPSEMLDARRSRARQPDEPGRRTTRPRRRESVGASRGRATPMR